MNPVNIHTAFAQPAPPVEAPSPPIEDRVASIHARCAPETCGFYDDLSAHLPPFPRSVTLSYLGNEEKARCFQGCGAAVPPPVVAFPEEARSGWKKSQCTEESVRDLLTEKMMMMAADATRRAKADKSNGDVLTKGFWYSNEYFEHLQAMQRHTDIERMREDGSFYLGLPPAGFSLVEDVRRIDSKRPYGYRLNPGVLPTQALANVKQTLCFIDCQEGVQLSQYEALLEIFGEDKFNDLFRADGNSPLHFDTQPANTSLFQFFSVGRLNLLESEEARRPVQPGDALYFKNDPFYSMRHLDGHMGGLHVMCIEPQKFVGFGLPPEGFTEDQILDLFVTEFNKPVLRISAICNAKLTEALLTDDGQNPIPAGHTEETLCKLREMRTISKENILKRIQMNPATTGLTNLVVFPNPIAIREVCDPPKMGKIPKSTAKFFIPDPF